MPKVKVFAFGCVALLVLSLPGGLRAQSSSLYTATPKPPQRVKGQLVNTDLEALSLTQVPRPEPKVFAVQDLLTIIIREQSSVKSESSLETEKDASVDAKIEGLPHLNLADLLKGNPRRSTQNDFPLVKATGTKDFEGEGEYERKDTMTTRLQARVVEVKPNGLLAVEARTFIQNDEEKLTISVTGFCRPDDVNPDNTILSTQIFDLRVVKVHEGELRRVTKKGLMTRIFEALSGI